MQYRKKPVVIEAVKWNGKCTDLSEWPEWFSDAVRSGVIRAGFNNDLQIETLEGHLWASNGDMIIRGVKGEIYACKPDIFEMTYEAVVPEPDVLKQTETPATTASQMLAGDTQNDGKTQGKTDHRRSVEK